MFRRSILGAFAIAAGIAAGLVLHAISRNSEEEEDIYDDDDEIHFIRINDDDEEPEEAEEPEEKKQKSGPFGPEVQEVCGLYPYLTADFVAETLAKNGELNAAYPEDTLITLTHSVGFENKEDADKFAEIMETANYQISTGKNNTLKAAKKLFTEDGAVISDVLNVANQASALRGKYKKYTIE